MPAVMADLKRLTEQDFKRAAKELSCDVAAIKAVAEIEAPRGGFLPDGRVTILFERHKFHLYTKGRHSPQNPDISNPKRGGYVGGAGEYERFNRAFVLDSTAAMLSASWGKFQVMGFNFALCGFTSVNDFVDAMKIGEGAQLDAFVEYVKHAGLADELRGHDWVRFARYYNGVEYWKHSYDLRLMRAHKKFAAQEVAV